MKFNECIEYIESKRYNSVNIISYNFNCNIRCIITVSKPYKTYIANYIPTTKELSQNKWFIRIKEIK